MPTDYRNDLCKAALAALAMGAVTLLALGMFAALCRLVPADYLWEEEPPIGTPIDCKAE